MGLRDVEFAFGRLNSLRELKAADAAVEGVERTIQAQKHSASPSDLASASEEPKSPAWHGVELAHTAQRFEAGEEEPLGLE